tara:strand:- start:702 stop:1346 length:645 start_codon:yes stop_codon:yes gene_type:complete
MSEIKYTTSNYVAVNKFIDNEYDRSRDKIKFQRSIIFRRYAIYGSLLILALSLLIFSIFFAHWLFKSKPENIVSNVKNEYITNNYNLEEELDTLKKIIEENKIQNTSSTETNVNKSEFKTHRITDQFFHFKSISIQLESGINTDVSTGMVYSPDEVTYPYSQYCYIMIDKYWVDLADKSGKQNYINDTYNQNLLSKYISRSDFNKSQKLCRFKN